MRYGLSDSIITTNSNLDCIIEKHMLSNIDIAINDELVPTTYKYGSINDSFNFTSTIQPLVEKAGLPTPTDILFNKVIINPMQIQTNFAICEVMTDTSIITCVEKYGESQKETDLVKMEVVSEGCVVKYGEDAFSDIKFDKQSIIMNLYGEEKFFISGFELQPGEEIIIDTCSMTIIVNGKNGMKYLHPSLDDFIKLLPGINTLRFAAEENSKFDLDILWKDRWI